MIDQSSFVASKSINGNICKGNSSRLKAFELRCDASGGILGRDFGMFIL